MVDVKNCFFLTLADVSKANLTRTNILMIGDPMRKESFQNENSSHLNLRVNQTLKVHGKKIGL
jgi:hypothetical protein